jgi:hypothetical protein
VVKQLPVEMLQQCSGAASGMQDVHCHGGALHQMSAFHAFCSEALHSFFGVSQYTFDIIMVPCCMNFTITTPFLSHKTVAIRFVAGRQCLIELFWLFW